MKPTQPKTRPSNSKSSPSGEDRMKARKGSGAKFASGGMVRGCKPGQATGKKHSGTY